MGISTPAGFFLETTFSIFGEIVGDLLNAHERLSPDQEQDSLLRRFRKHVVKSGVLSTIRKKQWYISTSEQNRMAMKKANTIHHRKLMKIV